MYFVFSFRRIYVCFVLITLFIMKHASKSPFVIAWVLLIATLAFAATSLIQGEIGSDIPAGEFYPTGNAWKITLMTQAQVNTAGIPGLTLEGDDTSAYLTGNMFLQTVGYVNFNPSNVSVIPPPGSDESVILPWRVTGTAWSENAGWITLDSLTPSSYSWVYYVPTSGSLTGIAWSDTLGYIDFSGNSSTGSELVARVKVIWNAGGMSTFDSLFVANNGLIRTNSVLTPFLNNVRRNVSVLTRNATDTVMNTVSTTQKNLGSILYYRLNGGSVTLSTITTFCATDNSPRSLIVDGGDVVIDRDVSGSARSCAIISLSNGTTGGNIYITSAPKVIQSYLVAEWTVYAGTSAANLYNDTKVKLANLPSNQLYVLWGVISRNTIGGALTDTVARWACPFTEDNCNRDVAIKYDLNFFRNYTKTPSTRAYTKNDSLENFSFIIEYDARAAWDTPPGL